MNKTFSIQLNKNICLSYKLILYFFLFFTGNFNIAFATQLNIYNLDALKETHEIEKVNTDILDKFGLYGIAKHDNKTTPQNIERIDFQLSYIHFSKRVGYFFKLYAKGDKTCCGSYKYLDFFPEINSGILDIKTNLDNTRTKIIEIEESDCSHSYVNHIEHEVIIVPCTDISFMYSNETETLLLFLKRPIFVFDNKKLVKILSSEIYIYRLKSVKSLHDIHY